jgi:tricarballylate dehydrogenase
MESSMRNENGPHVIVVGGGNAALCAALAASEGGARVSMVERAPKEERGGNSYFTGGIIRFPFDTVDDLVASFPELGGGETETIEVEPYPEQAFFEDMARTTEYRADPDLTAALVREARGTMEWLHSHGARVLWSLGRHAHKVEGRYRFYGGAVVTFWGGGPGLVDALYEAAEAAGVEIRYGSRVVGLLGAEDGRVTGVRVHQSDNIHVQLDAEAVVLASGGFQANTAMRTQYLGPGWDLARVRGTRFNTGDGHRIAEAVGAQTFGHWSGCHAVAWDANAPLTGDRKLGDEFSRHSYPMGIVVNKDANRFLDEGADFHTHTYAKYGAKVLEQPGMVAYQLFDAKVMRFLRGDYLGRHVTKVTADTIEDLASRLELDPDALTETVARFNVSIQSDAAFDPNRKDGRSTTGVEPPKSNWALALDEPPFVAYPVTTGITFTFGGLRIDEHGRVLDTSERPIPGLYAAGELVGGIFYHNYPTGTGLMTGAVFGRAAGASAAREQVS